MFKSMEGRWVLRTFKSVLFQLALQIQPQCPQLLKIFNVPTLLAVGRV